MEIILQEEPLATDTTVVSSMREAGSLNMKIVNACPTTAEHVPGSAIATPDRSKPQQHILPVVIIRYGVRELFAARLHLTWTVNSL